MAIEHPGLTRWLWIYLSETLFCMIKKKIGRPNEERRARQLLERIARKKTSQKKVAKDPAAPCNPAPDGLKRN